MDREKVIAWLTEISLRPCDFATDDFDAYETEHLADEALEICEDAKVFNKQRNDALALLKELEPVEPEMEGGGSSWWMVCGECHGQIDEKDDYCRHCGRRILRNEKRE